MARLSIPSRCEAASLLLLLGGRLLPPRPQPEQRQASAWPTGTDAGLQGMGCRGGLRGCLCCSHCPRRFQVLGIISRIPLVHRRVLRQGLDERMVTLGAGGGGSPRGELHPLQDTLPRTLPDRRMVEQTRVTHPLPHEKEASVHPSWAEAAPPEQPRGALCSSPQARQARVERLGSRLQHLRELDVFKGSHQSELSRRQGCEGAVERQKLDLLQHQCQALREQLSGYEEMAQELELSQQQEREWHRQEQLAQARHRVSFLESMLGLYKKKYQALLGRAGELESQRQQLAEELASQVKEREEAAWKMHTEQLSLQEDLRSRCHQVARAEDTMAQLLQELRGAQEELAQGQHLAGQYRETTQGLQEQLAASHTKFLDQEAALAVLHKDFTAYQAAHAFSNSSYESQVVSTEALRQKLLQVEGESSEHQRQAEEYQALARELKRELAGVAARKHRATEDAARLERDLQSLRLEAGAAQERQRLEAAEQQQRAQLLEVELQQSRQLCAQKEQAIQEQDEVLCKSQRELVHARSALQEKGWEVAQQRAAAQQLESSLQSAQEELRQSQSECATLHMELQALQESLQESREQEQQTAQELAQQKELVLLAQSSLCRAQEELSEQVAEGLHHEQAGQRMEAELRVLKDRVAAAEAEREQKRVLLEELMQELSQSQQRHQEAAREAKRHQQTAVQLELNLESSRERLKGLQQRWQEQQQKAQSLQSIVREQEVENQTLREQLKQHAPQLEAARRNVEHLQFKLQQQAAEARQQEAALSQLHTELHAAQERECTVAAAQDLERQVASCQASQREALEQLEERGREVCRLHADLQLSQHKEAHLEEELAASREQAQQLRSRLQALQRQREEEARSSAERLGELDRDGRRWRDKHREAGQALADKDEELVLLKVELATLEEKHHAAAGQVEALQTSLQVERAVTRRLHQESELMVGHIGQWVQEQKQVNEKLGHRIQDQVKQIAQLTGARDHLQGLTERLQQENKQLKDEVDELRIEQECFKALHSNAWDAHAGRRQPWPGKDPAQCPGQR